jgi:hypothetical protein
MLATVMPRRSLQSIALGCAVFGLAFGTHDDCFAADPTMSDFIGTFMLAIKDSQKPVPTTHVCEIKDAQIRCVIEVDRKPWGMCTVQGRELVVEPLPPKQGTLSLKRRSAGELVGWHKGDGAATEWVLKRTRVVYRWLHQAGTGKPREIQLWSTGRINAPDGRASWKYNPAKRELILYWAESRDTCTVSEDGRSYRGRSNNKKKSLITGTLIEEGE